MAGMLPGVESARRRRFHGNGGWSDSPTSSSAYASSTRRISFCLYSGGTTNESHFGSFSFLQRSMANQVTSQDDKLEGVAREAKERLDGRLRAQWNSDIKRTRSQETLRGTSAASVEERRPVVEGEWHTELFGLKKNGSKRFSWGKKMRQKAASDQEECAVCLDQFKVGETLAHLPCNHRFHSSCLVPWLENNAHCPCCRMHILMTYH